jgi:SAM-dependent methyltransferase
VSGATSGSEPGYFDREYFRLYPGKAAYVAALAAQVGARVPPGGAVLDLGAGFGFLVAALRDAGLASCGLERSAFAASRARHRSALAVGDAERPLPFADAAFAAITFCDVVEHVRDPVATLAECRRVLAPGGWLLVITLNAHSVARPLLGRSWAWHRDPTHLHMFSRGSLRRALGAAGFAPPRIRTVFNLLTVGESNPLLKPLRALPLLVAVPWVGDALWAWARRPGDGAGGSLREGAAPPGAGGAAP